MIDISGQLLQSLQNAIESINVFGSEMVYFAYIVFAFALFPFIFRTLFNRTGKYIKARLRQSDSVERAIRAIEYRQNEAISLRNQEKLSELQHREDF